MNTMASVQKILDIQPNPNADALDTATVQGWKVVVKRNEFKVGDLIVFILIDSIVPDRPEFEFLRKYNMRVKSVKLRGQISQGLIVPLSVLPEGNYVEDQDVSEILGVTHYQKPEPNSPRAPMGDNSGNFPSQYVPKTDETLLQSKIRVLDEMKGKDYYITVKCDGSSMTVYFHDGHFGVCSRNWEKKEEGNSVFWKVVNQYNLKNKMTLMGKNFAIQAECVGEGIQKNRMKIVGNDMFVFNVWDIDKQCYLNFSDAKMVVESLGVKMVPLVEFGQNFGYNLDQLLLMAEGNYEGTSNRREGIVVRPWREEWSQAMRGRMSFKVLNNQYLLEHGE